MGRYWTLFGHYGTLLGITGHHWDIIWTLFGHYGTSLGHHFCSMPALIMAVLRARRDQYRSSVGLASDLRGKPIDSSPLGGNKRHYCKPYAMLCYSKSESMVQLFTHYETLLAHYGTSWDINGTILGHYWNTMGH